MVSTRCRKRVGRLKSVEWAAEPHQFRTDYIVLGLENGRRRKGPSVGPWSGGGGGGGESGKETFMKTGLGAASVLSIQ